MMNIPTRSPHELSEASRSGPVDLIDVRTPVEFQEVHLSIAKNIPLDRLDPHAVIRDRIAAESEPIYLICRSGGRGGKACEKFLAAGFTNVVNVEGGTLACVAAGHPVVRGAKVMSLERQVRIAAGLLVLLGVGLAYFLHPALIGISAFVGAGLVFAGITDTCAMGMLLARMPWNRGHTATSCRVPGTKGA